jgi:hsp70-interacting protein
MQSLLRWSIENSAAPDAAAGAGVAGSSAPAPRKDLDPAVIDHILGVPDAQRMKDALAAATDRSAAPDARVAALDDLEMLVEHIDNATGARSRLVRAGAAGC